MKLERTNVTYEGNTPIIREKFSISDAALVADLLSNMYTNPIQAVVREYIANAIDSHAAAGKSDVPIRVKSPTIIDPVFEVEDTGVGLSKNEVSNLIFSFGGSNKRDTNTQIGGFGIGSKSGFSYVDDFIIESTKDGETCTYLCFKDGENGPDYELISSVQSEKPNGVSVRIKVKLSDVGLFEKEIVKLVYTLDKPVDVSGISTKLEKPLVTHKDFLIVSNQVFSGQNVFVCMGGIVYSTNYLGGTGSYRDSDFFYPFLRPIILNFPIGTFKLAPSREAIILKQEYLPVLRARLREAESFLNKKHIDSLKNSPTAYRAAMSHKNSTDIFYKGKTFKYKSYNLYRRLKTGFVTYRRKVKIQKEQVHFTDLKYIVDIGERQFRTPKLEYALREQGLQLSGGDKFLILSGTPKQRFREWVRAGRPDIPYIDLINLKLPKTSRVKKEVTFSIYENSTRYVKSSEIDVNDKKDIRYYLKMEHSHINICGVDIYAFNRALVELLEISNIKLDVVLVPKTIWNTIPDHWVELRTDIENCVHDYFTKLEIYNSKLQVCHNFRTYLYLEKLKGKFPTFRDEIDQVFDDFKYYDALNLPTLDTSHTFLIDIYSLKYNLVQITGYNQSIHYRFGAIETGILLVYPLLIYLKKPYNQEAIDYIDLINEAKQLRTTNSIPSKNQLSSEKEEI